MCAAFLGRILGFPAADRASTSPGSGPDGGMASSPRSGGATCSTQYKAVTRPYRCSQDSPALRSGNVIGDGDGASMKSFTSEGGGFSLSRAGRLSLMSIGSSIGIGAGQSSAYKASASQGSSGALHLNELTLPAPPCSTAAMSSLGQKGLGVNTTALSSASAASRAAVSGEHARRFEEVLRGDSVDMTLLRELSWQGCPVALRYEAWMFLTGCWTAQAAKRQPTVSRRRVEYAAYIHSTYGIVDWDAVCAMVDSGVDTAVHRSTLKSLEHSASAPPVIGTPRQTPLTELVAAPPGASRSLLRAASLTSSGSTAMLASEAVASPLPSLPHYTSGLLPASFSVEDFRSSLRQSLSEEDSRPPSRLSRAPSMGLLTASSSLGTMHAFSGTPFRASASAGSIDAVGASPPLHLQVSPSPSTSLATQRLLTAVPATAPSAVAGSGGAAAGHLLSASTMLGSKELQTLKQIRKDIPRMSGGHCYLRHPRVQGSIERILFIWSLRHPACGYVQGMNDLVVPFMGVVLSHRFCPTRSITELHAYTEDIFDDLWSMSEVPVAQWINEVEADVYWMTSYLLNTMQDNYTSSHAGITTMMRHLAAVVQAADPPLYHRLVDVLQLHFEQFSFRWMNCLLMRELTETQSLRLLDAYLSDEERRWSVTHVYVCAALLLRWGPQLMSFGEDYISAMRFLQAPPTEQLSLRDMQDVMSEGYVLQNLYEASLKRLSTTAK
ncbi:hypothetical protein GH5_02698 [Leishmania sp. Ghana 2012 LV757]|uniref:hypothetical protein n=1 Tax=Leishmania sp. Ghana 2012 LV757 TaxID=2803181 RepID=UPI001B3FD7B8|nr:hypothetical protein GH5_02698 [Leishmania sp. Ghana 2012 LV757]